jgi:glycolate oxidase iron-sulfur subunit
MANAVSKCVHCGFCLASCPTYQTLGEEMDSPRGRIVLMKAALEGGLTVEETLPFIDRCLGCLACVTACPSGVPYQDLLMPYRELAEERRSRPAAQNVARRLAERTLPYPRRFALAARGGRLVRRWRATLPDPLATMLELIPAKLPQAKPLPAFYPAVGPPRARVALLTGCVQQVLAPQINWATLRVLAKNGIEVVLPPGQGCCGALLMHNGSAAAARAMARQNRGAFPADVDAIITNAAGCGSAMKEYGLLFAGQPDQAEATVFGQRVRDIAEFLDELGIEAPPPLRMPLRVAYHDACHLAHAQRVAEAPRRLLAAIPDVTLVEVAEGELCCGSAGSYNFEQPAIAAALGRRKAHNILRQEPQLVATGNIGCIVQLRRFLDRPGPPIPVLHTVELLDLAYRRADRLQESASPDISP